MSRLSHLGYLLVAATLILAGVHVCDPVLFAQEPQAANIITVDGVKLKSYFYPGKKDAPTVIMLHPVGEGKSVKSQDWKALAETLQKGGYSVMMFDFRGHGDSTSVDADVFWTFPMNKGAIRTKEKNDIDVKDFINSPTYLPVLVNDIAAVKAYLDRMHDKGGCNTSNTIVIGAESGGSLGAIWINSEWNRYRLTPPAMFGKQATISKRAEGNDVIAAVFLTATPNITAKKTLSLPNVLANASKVHGMATWFLYGEKDAKAKDFAKMLESKLKLKDKDGKTLRKHEFIASSEIPNTNLSGMKLLAKSLGTDAAIVKFLDGVVTDRANEYIERDATEALYVWRIPGAVQPIPSKNKKGERNLLFSDYSAFAQ